MIWILKVFRIYSRELNIKYQKDFNCIFSQVLIFKVDFILKIVGLPCASRSRLVGGGGGDKGSVHAE